MMLFGFILIMTAAASFFVINRIAGSKVGRLLG